MPDDVTPPIITDDSSIIDAFNTDMEDVVAAGKEALSQAHILNAIRVGDYGSGLQELYNNMLYIPYKLQHECIPLSKRLSISFPFWPGENNG